MRANILGVFFGIEFVDLEKGKSEDDDFFF